MHLVFTHDPLPTKLSSLCAVGGIEGPRNFEFDNALQGNDIPPEFHSAIEKGFIEAANSGSLIGAPVEVQAYRLTLLVGSRI